MLPRVVLHVEASLDGRIDWIKPDIGRFYKLASRFHEDAILTGADTLIEGPGLPEEDDARPPTPEAIGGGAPLLAVVDSRCRFTLWNWLRKQQYWSDAVALVAGATSREACERLVGQGVTVLATGGDRVDLRAALELLNERYGVQTVRVDSGGGLRAWNQPIRPQDLAALLDAARSRRRGSDGEGVRLRLVPDAGVPWGTVKGLVARLEATGLPLELQLP